MKKTITAPKQEWVWLGTLLMSVAELEVTLERKRANAKLLNRWTRRIVKELEK